VKKLQMLPIVSKRSREAFARPTVARLYLGLTVRRTMLSERPIEDKPFKLKAAAQMSPALLETVFWYRRFNRPEGSSSKIAALVPSERNSR